MLSRAELLSQRAPGTTEDVHFTESLAAAMIEEYSQPGDLVLDPFAGFGTTPRVATRMGRRAVAIELLDERSAIIRQRLHGAADVITGDARQLGSLIGGPVDLCLTSPPYMTATGHPQNPLTAYATADGDYHTYLDELTAVFRQVATRACRAQCRQPGDGRCDHPAGLGHRSVRQRDPHAAPGRLPLLGSASARDQRRLLPDLPEIRLVAQHRGNWRVL